MSYVILQLSDLHMGARFRYNGKEWGERVGESLSKENDKIIRKIVMTGDIFDKRATKAKPKSSMAVSLSDTSEESDSGNSKNPKDEKTREEWVSQAVDFFNALLEKINDVQKDSWEHIVLTKEDVMFIPGNHDVCLGKGEDSPWSLYDSFLKEFYGKNFPDFYDMENHMVRYTDTTYKVQFLGFNSCSARNEKIEVDNPYINSAQIKEAECEVRNENNSDCYRIAFFHHPNYLFQEMARDDNAGIQINSKSFSEELAGWNVKAILHGHKHMFDSHISRPRIGQKIYVIACGAIGGGKIDQRSCNLIEIIGDNESRELKLVRLESNNKVGFKRVEQKLEDNYSKGMLYENLARENKGYRETEGSEVDNVVNMINALYVNGDSLSILMGNPNYFHLMVEGVRYRIGVWNRHGNNCPLPGEKEMDFTDTEKDFVEALKKILGDEHEELETLLEDANFMFSRDLKQNMEKSKKLKRCTAYLLIAAMFTDLYMTFGNEQLQSWNGGGINNPGSNKGRVAFRKNDGVKYDISFGYLQICLKCYDIETEKAAVSAVYEIRNRYNVVWGCLSSIGICIRNIIPEIENLGMNGLGWYEMDASIPQMIRLLTGTNIYDSDFVFVRELVQNSIDAISFREKLERPSEEWKKDIQVEVGQESNGKYYFKIADHGIGMGREIIEHYFTTLGKSYYKENDDGKSTKYNSISNFGIGFLSVFRPCQEIVIRTRHFVEKTYYKLQIRNDQDYYLVDTKEDEKFGVGMETTCYLKDGSWEYIGNLLRYLRNRMLDIKYNICIELAGQELNRGTQGLLLTQEDTEPIKSRAVRHVEGSKIYIPFNEDEGVIGEIDNLDEIIKGDFIQNHRHGMMIQLDADAKALVKPGMVVVLNAGVLMENAKVEDILGIKEPLEYPKHIGVVLNFPPKWLEIDVSREKVICFRSMYSENGDERGFNAEGEELEIFKQGIYESFCSQLGKLMDKKEYKKTSLAALSETLKFMEIFHAEDNHGKARPDGREDIPNESYLSACKKTNEAKRSIREISQAVPKCINENANLTLKVEFGKSGDNMIDFRICGMGDFKDNLLNEGKWILDIRYCYGDDEGKGRSLHNSLISLFGEICERDAGLKLIQSVNSPHVGETVSDILMRVGINCDNIKPKKYLPFVLAACLKAESMEYESEKSESEKTAEILIYNTILRECSLRDVNRRGKPLLSVQWEAKESSRIDMESDSLGEMIRRIAKDESVDVYDYIWKNIFFVIYEEYYESQKGIWEGIREKGQRGYLAAKDKIKGLYANNSENALIDPYMIAGCYADALLRVSKELSAQMVKEQGKPDDIRYQWILDCSTQFLYVWKKSEYILNFA